MKLSNNVRVRFAPSPTGYLHIGNARAAVMNFIFARKHGGDCILRFEDTDLERSSSKFERAILEDLKWLGLVFDENPFIGGDFGPYRQMERLDLYKKYIEHLIAKGFARRISDDSGLGEAVCFSSSGEIVEFQDEVFGKVRKEVEDFIIMRSNGIPTYHFAVVVDDHAMQISHVIRGQDHLGNTAKHVLLARAFDWQPPKYAHYSLTFGLSKRFGGLSLRDLRECGYAPEAIVNMCMLLGWAPKDQKEKFNIMDKLEEFELPNLSRVNSNFDLMKLKWLSGEYIRCYSEDKLLHLSLPFLKKSFPHVHLDMDNIHKPVQLVKNDLSSLSELSEKLQFLYVEPCVQDIRDLISGAEEQKLLVMCRDSLKGVDSWKHFEGSLWLKSVQVLSGKKGKDLYLPIRLVTTGLQHGPALDQCLSLLGRASVLKRIQHAIEE